MAWDWLKKKLGGGAAAGNAASGVRWLDAAASPWGVPVLDLRPFALSMISTSKDAQQAENAMSFGRDDGTGFVGIAPRHAKRRVPAHLRYAVDAPLADGALFLPSQMEHKWALYLHQNTILFVRSWTREVVAVASVRLIEDGRQMEITEIAGAMTMVEEEPEFTVRAADFLLRSHALALDVPAPLPAEIAGDLNVAAQWCFSQFGNRALFAACDPVVAAPPPPLLRTYSLLHMAVARGDATGVEAALAHGIPADVRGRDGLTPLQWSVAEPDTRMAELLLARGARVDATSDEGATALMNAVQEADGLPHVACLLAHGADARAADARGFTALHRAAEMGKLEIARLLLAHGASAQAVAEGHTPLSLAEGRKETAMAELLRAG